MAIIPYSQILPVVVQDNNDAFLVLHFGWRGSEDGDVWLVWLGCGELGKVEEGEASSGGAFEDFFSDTVFVFFGQLVEWKWVRRRAGDLRFKASRCMML